MKVVLSVIVSSSDKPALEDLQCFLEFQVPSQWAPLFCELPLSHQRKVASYPALQFCLFGPKLCVRPTQVLLGISFLAKRPLLYYKYKKKLKLYVLHFNEILVWPWLLMHWY